MFGRDVTPYTEVNEVLRALVEGVQAVLGEQLTGVYLYGSLSSGDFDPRSSDIDFVVVAEDDFSEDQIAALEALHSRLWASEMKWAAKLEGSYISRQAFRRYDPAGGPYPSVNDGRFFLAGHGSDWIIQRHIVREHSPALVGPPPNTLIDPVMPEDLRYGAVGVLPAWWIPIVQERQNWLAPRIYQAFAVLTMCRVLYTVQHSAIASKPVSAQWASGALDERWHGVIERALAWPIEPQEDEFSATLAFIRFTVARCEEEGLLC